MSRECKQEFPLFFTRKVWEYIQGSHLIGYLWVQAIGIFFDHRWKKSSNNENTVKSTAFWLSVWKKWCLEKGIAKEIENYEPTQLHTLLEWFYAEIKNKHG